MCAILNSFLLGTFPIITQTEKSRKYLSRAANLPHSAGKHQTQDVEGGREHSS
jgi:hypothetical protein